MYRTILVGVDGSSCSERATVEAARVARSLGSEVTLLHALDTYALLRDGMVAFDEVHRHLREEGERELSRAKDLCAAEGIAPATLLVEGAPLDELLRAASRFDLVVLGFHGRGFAKRLLMGSVANAVLHHVTKPVLVVTDRSEPRG